MQLIGEWFEGDDGIVRPTFSVDICWGTRRLPAVRFVLDTGADQTVLSADLLPYLPVPQPPPTDLTLSGVGGTSAFGTVRATLEFPRHDVVPVAIRGEFAVFTDLRALDMPVLGRVVTDHFDIIVSRRHDAVLLLGGMHRFAVRES